jgi:predicted RNA binding protein YcfA (HicA-like mRNA interferase family)
MKKPLPDTTLNVTIPLHDELDRTTLRSIIKAAELTEEEFMKLLE